MLNICLLCNALSTSHSEKETIGKTLGYEAGEGARLSGFPALRKKELWKMKYQVNPPI